jgi:hypothetical protein
MIFIPVGSLRSDHWRQRLTLENVADLFLEAKKRAADAGEISLIDLQGIPPIMRGDGFDPWQADRSGEFGV